MKVPVQTLSEDFQGSDALENSHGQITQWVDLIPLFGVSLFPYDIAFGWIIMKQFYFYEIVNFAGGGNVYSCPDCGSRYYHMALFVEFYSYLGSLSNIVWWKFLPKKCCLKFLAEMRCTPPLRKICGLFALNKVNNAPIDWNRSKRARKIKKG